MNISEVKRSGLKRLLNFDLSKGYKKYVVQATGRQGEAGSFVAVPGRHQIQKAQSYFSALQKFAWAWLRPAATPDC